jgi:hypothetical protein
MLFMSETVMKRSGTVMNGQERSKYGQERSGTVRNVSRNGQERSGTVMVTVRNGEQSGTSTNHGVVIAVTLMEFTFQKRQESL